MEKSSPVSAQRLAQRRGDYGFDAPSEFIKFILRGLVVLVLGVRVPLLQRARSEHGDRKGSPLRYTLRPPRHRSRSGIGSAPAMQKHDAHP